MAKPTKRRMDTSTRYVKEIYKEGLPKYFNSLADVFFNIDYDKAVDMMMTGVNEIPEDTFRAIKAFLVIEDQTTSLDVNSSGDTFTISAFEAINELVNEMGIDTQYEGNHIVIVAFDVPLEQVPDDVIFNENRDVFSLVMKDFDIDYKVLKVHKISKMDLRLDPKFNVVEIDRMETKYDDDKDFIVKVK